MRRLTNAVRHMRAEREAKRRTARLHQRLRPLPTRLSADEAVDFVFSEAGEPIQPWQHSSELRSLARLVAERRPRTLLEIGTADDGDSPAVLTADRFEEMHASGRLFAREFDPQVDADVFDRLDERLDLAASPHPAADSR